MTKNTIIAEHVLVTFFEAGIAYLAINQTNLSGNPKIVVIGAVGAALSAAYNLLRQSTPTIPDAPTVVLPLPPYLAKGLTVAPTTDANNDTTVNTVDTPPVNPVV